MYYFQTLTWQEGDLWVAKCLNNSIASQGGTKSEARINLREALDLTMEDNVDSKIPQVQIKNLELDRIAVPA